jgi:MoxR-like ATPase
VRFVPAKARSPLSTSNPGTSASPRSSGDAPSAAVAAAAELTAALRAELAEVVVGQEHLIEGLLIGLLADGHVLLEGVPGLAKSLVVQALAEAIGASHHRVQFTPDLLPADLVGTQVYDPQRGVWSIHEGPVFANLVLADEINRAPAKVQSALLEAMQERQVSIGGETRPLPEPFLVLATQNPLEQEGTYRLPEAQLDRFMLKLVVGYPTREEERAIVDRMARVHARRHVQAVTDTARVLAAREALDEVHVDPRVRDYAIDLVFCSREPQEYGLGDLVPFVRYGASPRASIALVQASRARALLRGRGFVVPEDVQAVGLEVLRHRVLPTFEAEARQMSVDAVVERILATVPVP